MPDWTRPALLPAGGAGWVVCARKRARKLRVREANRFSYSSLLYSIAAQRRATVKQLLRRRETTGPVMATAGA